MTTREENNCSCCEGEDEVELAARLDEMIVEHRDRAGGLIPLLQAAQGLYGYLPEPVMKRIAGGLGISYSEVAGVVGFYSYFSTRPRGRHLIRVCLGTACYVRGGRDVLDVLRTELGVEVGETTPDGEFTLEVGRCFGACGLAPVITIDDQVYQRVRRNRIRGILDSYRAVAISQEEGAK